MSNGILQIHGYELGALLGDFEEKQCGNCGDLIPVDEPTVCYPCSRRIEREANESEYWREFTGTCQGFTRKDLGR